jgi:hypothetical protein
MFHRKVAALDQTSLPLITTNCQKSAKSPALSYGT